MILTLKILAIITMTTLISVSILGIILLAKILNQKRYSNYIMEKLCQHMYLLTKKCRENKTDNE
ncbi:hypothetical protein CLOACE_11430 [Clostridium acetireducens DSM 10703]|uniref:Uncharacterized protein n=1 Tax=Clostridium acetireducens DSM 10703 TaxID=1121290 RepID=A0A1E8EYZ7_9CLOT|nr:hypothetical protein [Clostridium acetireducens]OFI06244.1 hypothetical protein CLOACE_11430 [Clostridium acetireducens DSM 10703]